jgi:hypothetical protein
VEGRELLGQVVVRRLPYRTVSGVEEMSGLSAVTTRVDARRRGVARALLTEAHAREAASGRRFSLLWTSPGWYAHQLYRDLGYSDVWMPPLAARALAPRRRRSSERLGAATARELAALEALHEAVTQGAVGFSPRGPQALRGRHAGGALDLSTLWVLRRRGTPVGYAAVSSTPNLTRCGEMVAPPPLEGPLLDALEARAAPGGLVLHRSPAQRMARELRRRGYAFRGPGEWRVLMACPLAGSWEPAALRAELGVDRTEFVCMSHDGF